MSKRTNPKVVSLTIKHDEYPESPREWTNLGVMACWHSRSQLGDVTLPGNEEAIKSWIARNAPEGSVVLPLYLYEHSGMTMSTGNDRYPLTDPWDSGQVGLIVASPDAIRKTYAVKRLTKKVLEKVKKDLKTEVRVYDNFLTGQHWGYIVGYDNHTDDSCTGFFGGTLEETGLAEAVPEAARPLLEEAWNQRS